MPAERRVKHMMDVQFPNNSGEQTAITRNLQSNIGDLWNCLWFDPRHSVDRRGFRIDVSN